MRTLLAQSEPMSFEGDPAARAQFRELWAGYQTLHVGDPQDANRVLMFQRLLAIANAAPAGDYAELGVHKGLTARLIWRLMDKARGLWLFDTFEGFDQRDVDAERAVSSVPWTAGNFLPTSMPEVSGYVAAGGGGPDLNFVPGWFPGSFEAWRATLEPMSWRFVHVDMDLCAPIKSALEVFWPSVVPGGVVLVHDCGCADFPGAKKATNEFAASVGLVPVPMCDAWGSAVLIKPKQ